MDKPTSPEINELHEALIYLETALKAAHFNLDSVLDRMSNDGINVPKWADIDIRGVGSTLKCFSLLCGKLSESSDGWVQWAAKEAQP